MDENWRACVRALLTVAAVSVVGLATHAVTRRHCCQGWRNVDSEEDIRNMLPPDLPTWRALGKTDEDDDAKWAPLQSVFIRRGYTFWRRTSHTCMCPPTSAETMTSGFGYATLHRGLGKFNDYDSWLYMNPLSRAARTAQGQDVIVRVVTIRKEGQDHLRILQKIARGRLSLFSENHALPVLDEIVLRDITFCVFPRSGFTLETAYGSWAQNSVGDVVNMVMQALEGLAFLHERRIAHQDAFKSNFIVEWMPESLLCDNIQTSFPRVFIIDFETAVEFPDDRPLHECRRIGPPGGLPGMPYKRPVPPEVASGQPYDPFKLDIWQLGNDLCDFKSTISPIDTALAAMIDPNASSRPSAAETLRRLAEVVSTVPPRSLRIKPDLPPLPF